MFLLRIDTGNAAFHSDVPEHDSLATSYEIARILHDVMKSLAAGKESGACVDANGNNLGRWSIERQ